ncbi:MAG: hemin uptake protein HemP [Pseudomonadota bacterium]
MDRITTPRERATEPMDDGPPIHNASVLTRGGDIARIAHGGQVYTLRITRQGKLILTK